MLIVLSPAKALELDRTLPTRRHSTPELLDEAKGLASLMQAKTPRDLEQLMSISENLAALTAERFASWTGDLDSPHARQAVFTFNGDVYRGLEPFTMTSRDITQVQKTVRILSGLYGVLRPLDLIEPYRLEMGSRLTTTRGTSLVEYWSDRVAIALNAAVAASSGSKVLINLASQEYFAAVDRLTLDYPVVTPRFLDTIRDGSLRVVSFHAKRARGLMARWVIEKRINRPSLLTGFDREGYQYCAERSQPDSPVFIRGELGA